MKMQVLGMNLTLLRVFSSSLFCAYGTLINLSVLANLKFNFVYTQVLIIGDSITRGISWKGFEVEPYPGITAEKLRNKV